MSNAESVYEELRALVRERMLRDRGVPDVDALELRRTLNEFAAELHAGTPFEEALALAARSPEGLGLEDPPVEGATLASLPRPRDHERHMHQRARFEERQRRAAAARPAPKPAPELTPLDRALLAFLGGAELSTNSLAWDLGESPLDLELALVRLEGLGLVKRNGTNWRARP